MQKNTKIANLTRNGLGLASLGWALSMALVPQVSLAASEMGTSSAATEEELMTGNLKDSKVSIQPAFGMISYRDERDDATARASIGFTADSNFLKVFDPTPTRFFFGPATGLIFSHIGSASADFFGTGVDGGRTNSANLILIPVDLKVGYNIRDNFRLSARAGGNVTYRSVGNSVAWGDSSQELGDSGGWTMFPNVGLDLEVGVGKNTTVLIRPDYTFTPGTDVFSGSIGIGINMG
jgi:hypothetical protein